MSDERIPSKEAQPSGRKQEGAGTFVVHSLQPNQGMLLPPGRFEFVAPARILLLSRRGPRTPRSRSLRTISNLEERLEIKYNPSRNDHTMAMGPPGSFARTVIRSLLYGWAGAVLAIKHLSVDQLYGNNSLLPWVFGPLGALCGLIGATWVHELTHFFAVRLVGGHVHKIEIGTGRLLRCFRVMGTPCEIHESRTSGVVRYSLLSTENYRSKLFFITAAAPLASIFLAVGSFMLLRDFLNRYHPLTSDEYYLLVLLAGWTLASVLVLPGFLWPRSYNFEGSSMETDTLKLLTIPQLTDLEIKTRTLAAQDFLRTLEDVDPTTTSVDQALDRVKRSPNEQRSICTAAAILWIAHDSRALIYYQKLVTSFPHSGQRMKFIDQYLTCALEMNAVSTNPTGIDSLSQELVSANPQDLSALGTRGSVMVDLGHIKEGKALLEQVLAGTCCSLDQAYAHTFLALAEKAQGNLDKAREHAAQGARIEPHCPALNRVADFLPES